MLILDILYLSNGIVIQYHVHDALFVPLDVIHLDLHGERIENLILARQKKSQSFRVDPAKFSVNGPTKINACYPSLSRYWSL